MASREQRSSNIELLRVLSMLALVMHHFLVHGGLIGMEMSTNRIISYILVPAGKICFTSFVAISCWFLVNSSFKGERFVKTWLQVFFYNILFSWLALRMQTPEQPISIMAFLGALFPMTGNSHGYASAYLWFYLLLPILKKITNGLTKDATKYILFILGATQIFVPVIGTFISWTQYLQSEMLLFVFCYFVAYYMHNWPLRFQNNLGVLFAVFLIFTGFAVITNVAALFDSNGSRLLRVAQTLCGGGEFSIINIIAGFSLFLFFLNLRIPKIKWINILASTTFGILLFHDHNVLRPFVWKNLKNLRDWANISVGEFIGLLLAVSFGVFILGMIIDFIRQHFFEKILVEDRLSKCIGQYLDKVATEISSSRDCDCESNHRGEEQSISDSAESKNDRLSVSNHTIDLPVHAESRLVGDEINLVSKRKVTAMECLKVAATLIVFFLHTYIFSMERGFTINDRLWLLKTPAWAAVWIFFFLSGLNISRGFASGKYKENGLYTVKSIARFYFQRFVKIGIPTWIFSILALVIIEPGIIVQNPIILLKVLTFTYGNDPSSTAIGATWYVSTLMWLYLIAPFLMMLVEIIENRFKNTGLFVLWILGILGGWALREALGKQGVPWSSQIYVPFYCNIDIYLCGMICSKITVNKALQKKAFRCFAAVSLVGVVILNTRIYYLSDWNAECMFFYWYKMPSIYIIVLTVFAAAFKNEKTSGSVTAAAVAKNPLLLIKAFGQVSFEFYLVHSLVVSQIYQYVNAASPLRLHAKLLLFAFVVSTFLSAVMHQANKSICSKIRLKKEEH